MNAYLLIVLSEDPELVRLTARDSPGVLTHGNTAFRELEFGADQFLGFYDWLRDSTDGVLGVRITPHDHAVGLQQRLPTLSYMTWEGGEILRIRFVAGDVDEDRSVDQEFSVARAFPSADDKFCILLDAAELDATDFAVLGCD